MESNASGGKLNPRNSIGNVYLWSLSFLKPYKWTLLLLTLCGLFISAIELVIPKFIQYFIDVILPAKDFSIFYVMIGIVTLSLTVQMAFTAGQNLLQRILREKAGRDLQHFTFTHLRRLGFSYFENRPVGESLALVNTEVANVQRLYEFFPNMLLNLLFSVVVVGYMFTIHVPLTLIIFPCLLLYNIFGPYLDKKFRVLLEGMAQARKDYGQKMYESFSALKELRVFSSEKWDMGHIMQKQRAFNDGIFFTWVYFHIRQTVRWLSYYAGGAALFIYAFYLVKTGSLMVGEFVALLFYFFLAMQKMTVTITMITEQRVLMYQAAALYEFSLLKPDVEEASDPIRLPGIKGEIRFENVSFHYPNGPELFRKLNLTIHPGQSVAFVGTSGNGKSTLLKLISRFYDPQEGTIYLDGVPLREVSFDDFRGAIGYVFQETYLFGYSVKENIRFGNPEATDEEVMEAAKSAFAHDFIMELPEGYDTLVGERGVKLSGGQKQRVSIARMFIKNPSIVLLDEATSALDNISETEVQKALNRLLKGRTTITVAHRLSTIREADQIFVLEDGSVAEQGTYQELMNLKGIFYRLAQGQQTEQEGGVVVL